jgi:hypothetical protein
MEAYSFFGCTAAHMRFFCPLAAINPQDAVCNGLLVVQFDDASANSYVNEDEAAGGV